MCRLTSARESIIDSIEIDCAIDIAHFVCVYFYKNRNCTFNDSQVAIALSTFCEYEIYKIRELKNDFEGERGVTVTHFY
jgi:hypothetical protein